MTHSDTIPFFRFEDAFRGVSKRAEDRWHALWNGDLTVVSVGVGSSSLAKGAGSGARSAFRAPGLAITHRPQDGRRWRRLGRGHGPRQASRRSGDRLSSRHSGRRASDPGRQSRAVSSWRRRRANRIDGIPPLAEHPFFKHQQRIVLADVGIIDPDSIEDAIAAAPTARSSRSSSR